GRSLFLLARDDRILKCPHGCKQGRGSVDCPRAGNARHPPRSRMTIGHPLVRMCAASGGEANDTGHLTPETGLRAYPALGKTADALNLSAWLYRIAANACDTELQHRGRWHWQPWDGAVGPPGVRPGRRQRTSLTREEMRCSGQGMLSPMRP